MIATVSVLSEEPRGALESASAAVFHYGVVEVAAELLRPNFCHLPCDPTPGI